MPLTFECEHCGSSMTVPDEYAGKPGRCRSCGKRIVAPTLGAPPASSDFIEEPERPRPEPLANPPLPPPPIPGAYGTRPVAGPSGAYSPPPARAERGGTFRDMCATIAGSMGGFWPVLGWILWLGPNLWLTALKYPDLASVGMIAALIAGPLFLFWWVVDVVDQGLEFGQIVLCFFLLSCCGLIGWLYYWISVRD